MKKSLSILLAFVLLLSVTACGKASVEPAVETVQDSTVPTEAPTDPEPAAEINEPASTPEPSPSPVLPEEIDLSYRFTFLCNGKDGEKYGVSYHAYWYALELDCADLIMDYAHINVIRKSDGTRINGKLISVDGIEIEKSYVGLLCVDDHVEQGNLSTGRDNWLYTFVINSGEELDPNDIQIELTDVYDLLGNPVEIKNPVLELNAEPSSLNLHPKYLHGSNLFELDGYYYLYENNHIGFSSRGNGEYVMLTIRYINGDKYTLAESLKDNWYIVNGDAKSDGFLQECPPPSGYLNSVMMDDYNLFFGYETADGSDPALDTYESLGKVYFAYQNEGVTTIICK